MSAPRPLVQVAGIGVPKSATTWLYTCLIQHPELKGSTLDGPLNTRKELNFFDRRYDYGYDWYEGCFDAGPWKNVDFSVFYYYDPRVPSRIKSYNPDMKLLLCLRNPVDRAISQYRHDVRRGRQSLHRGFWAASERNPTYIGHGRYGTHLEEWLSHFTLDRLCVVDQDDIKSRPAEVLERVFSFLEIDYRFEPEAKEEVVNRSLVEGPGTVRRTMGRAVTGLRAAMGRRIADQLRSTAIADKVRSFRYVEVGGKTQLMSGSGDRRELASCFQEDLRRLSDLLGRDFSHWK